MDTAEQIRKLTSALAECNRFIAVESARSADLRPAETQQLLDWYLDYRDKLQNMMVDLWQQATV